MTRSDKVDRIEEFRPGIQVQPRLTSYKKSDNVDKADKVDKLDQFSGGTQCQLR